MSYIQKIDLRLSHQRAITHLYPFVCVCWEGGLTEEGGECEEEKGCADGGEASR